MKRIILLLLAIGTFTTSSAFAGVISSDIEKSNTYLEEARIMIRKGDLKNAEKQLNEALKLNKENADIYYEFGELEHSKGNTDKTIDYFTKAIQINPNREDFYLSRAVEEGQKLQLKAVIEDINKALELNPKCGQAYAILGALYARYGHHQEALEYINNAMKYDETMFDMLYPARAEVKVSLRDYDGAIADYNNAIKVVKQANNPKTAQKIEYFKQRIFELQEAKKAF